MLVAVTQCEVKSTRGEGRSTAQPVLDMVEVRAENVQVKIPSAPIITLPVILQELSCFGTSVIAFYLEAPSYI